MESALSLLSEKKLNGKKILHKLQNLNPNKKVYNRL